MLPNALKSRAIRSCCGVRDNAVPAINAPIIGASCAPLATAENPNVTPAAKTPIVEGERARVPIAANIFGTTNSVVTL